MKKRLFLALCICIITDWYIKNTIRSAGQSLRTTQTSLQASLKKL